jgi:hypothetical protein
MITDAPIITDMLFGVLHMLKVVTLLQQISELIKALMLDNARLEKSFIENVEHLVDIRTVDGEGYGLS